MAYLDDFLLIGTSYKRCKNAKICAIGLLTSLGFPISWEKVVSPTRRIKFLGVVIDSDLSRLELPPSKLNALLRMLNELGSKRKISKKELHVLVGHLSFAVTAIYGARMLTQIFIDALCSLKRAHHQLR